jgi:hypothetical protein
MMGAFLEVKETRAEYSGNVRPPLQALQDK